MVPLLLFLTGEYEHRLDSKNRLFIPTRLRESIYGERDGLGFFLVFGRNKILSLYPDEYYRRLAVSEGPGLVPSAERVDFERVTFALASHLDLDPQNRLTLPNVIWKVSRIKRLTKASRLLMSQRLLLLVLSSRAKPLYPLQTHIQKERRQPPKKTRLMRLLRLLKQTMILLGRTPLGTSHNPGQPASRVR